MRGNIEIKREDAGGGESKEKMGLEKRVRGRWVWRKMGLGEKGRILISRLK